MASGSRDLGSSGPGPVRRQVDPDRPEAVDDAVAETAVKAVGQDPEMVELERRHRRFVWPVTVFFLVYYLSLNVLAGAAPDFMGRKVFGQFTFGYLYALSQFLMAFVVAWYYSRWAARRIDPLATDLREKLQKARIREVAE